MKKCMYCKKEIESKGFNHKIGHFCSEEHFDKYYESLSNEELVELMNHMCVCSHEDEE